VILWCCLNAYIVNLYIAPCGVVTFNFNSAHLLRFQPTDITWFFCRKFTRIIVTQSSTIH
jgi:hypothetical protein